MKDEQTSRLERSESLAHPSEAGVLSLSVLHSPDASMLGQNVPLPRALTLGRRSETGLGIDDGGMSRRHATLVVRSDKYSVDIEDHGSTNGTFVDRGRVERATVVPPAIIRFGDTICELAIAAAPPPADARARGLIGSSAAFARVLGEVERVAPSHLSVLLTGETGTGKDLLARYVHARSERHGRFVAVNCAAIPGELAESYFFGHKRGAFTGASHDNPGFFVQAEGGTLFLDEVGELPSTLQAKLLRVLESRELLPVGGGGVVRCDVRVVAATNADLSAEVLSGGFRRDLYARLLGYGLRVPSLRERRADVLPLAAHFLRADAPERDLAFSASAAEQLLLYEWPMNVRELKATMARLALHDDLGVIRTADLARAMQPLAPAPAVEAVQARRGSRTPQRSELLELLSRHGGSVAALALHYGRHRKQIHRWLERHGIDPNELR